MSKRAVLRTGFIVAATAAIATILESKGASAAAAFVVVLVVSAAVAVYDLYSQPLSPDRSTPTDDKPKARRAAGGSS